VSAVRRVLRHATVPLDQLPCEIQQLIPFLDVFSLDQAMTEAGSTLADLQADPHVSIEELLSDEDERRWVRELVEHLPAQHAAAVRLRFGFGGTRPSSYLTIARQLGISERGAKRLVDEACSQLRDAMGDDPVATSDERPTKEDLVAI
jgi:DNA-directed RNA polymerase sigma subunit (sigma70/sigma32)